ncbi:MAG TPA: hypothetical protein VM913_06195 [Sphingomicrobium sp.]|jgi:hypothetical protein|nr:hypothetical protein [Sphingomicrobium sp.]
MRKSISLALWMTVAACAQQPRPAPIAPKSLSYEEHRRRHPDRYIETVEGQHAADCQRLEGAGLAKDY